MDLDFFEDIRNHFPVDMSEARLPLPEIITPYPCDSCDKLLTNFDANGNKCGNCGTVIPLKNRLTAFLAEIPHRHWKTVNGLPVPSKREVLR